MGLCDYCTSNMEFTKIYVCAVKCDKCKTERFVLYYNSPVKQKSQKGKVLSQTCMGNMRHLEKGYICHYCGIDTSRNPSTRTLDHKTPKSKGGRGYDNLVVACRSCNYDKADMPYSEYMAKIPHQNKNAL